LKFNTLADELFFNFIRIIATCLAQSFGVLQSFLNNSGLQNGLLHFSTLVWLENYFLNNDKVGFKRECYE